LNGVSSGARRVRRARRAARDQGRTDSLPPEPGAVNRDGVKKNGAPSRDGAPLTAYCNLLLQVLRYGLSDSVVGSCAAPATVIARSGLRNASRTALKPTANTLYVP
jgi:hypothetical protein